MGEIWGKIVGRDAVFGRIVDRVASETQVWQSASSLFDEGRWSPTYKLALLLALLDCCAENEKTSGSPPQTLVGMDT